MDALLWISVTLLFLVFWCFQFILLMMLEDEVFAGKYDKLIWGGVFVFLAPLAPFVFHYWRRATLQLRKQNKQSQQKDGAVPQEPARSTDS